MSEEREPIARRLGLTRDKADAYYRRGLAAFDKGELEDAILDLSEAIHYDSGYADYYSTRGLFYVVRDQGPEAEADLRYALKLSKRQWLAYFALGMLDFAREEYESAARNFTTAQQINRSRPEIWFYRAVTYYYLGEDEKAAADVEEAIRLFPEDDKRRKEAQAWQKEVKKNVPKTKSPAKPATPPLKRADPPKEVAAPPHSPRLEAGDKPPGQSHLLPPGKK